MNTNNPKIAKLFSSLLICLLGVTATQTMATNSPRLQFSVGDVQVLNSRGELRPIIKGEVLLPGEKLLTGSEGMAQLRVFGQGTIALRASSEIQLMPPENGQFDILMQKGLIRTVTLLPGKSGIIKIITPGADIQVSAGDNQTAITNGDKSTINQALSGDVKIKVAGIETKSQLGSVVQIDAKGRNIKQLNQAPDIMTLRVPPRTRTTAANNSNNTRITSPIRNPVLGNTRNRFTPGPLKPPVKTPGSNPFGRQLAENLTPPKNLPTTPKYDGPKIIDPRITGAGNSVDVINDTIILAFKSSLSKQSSFVPVKTNDPTIRQRLTDKAEIVNLVSTSKTVDNKAVLSNTRFPGLEVVTFTGSLSSNPVLSNVIDPTKTTNCASRIKCSGGINTQIGIIRQPPKKK